MDNKIDLDLLVDKHGDYLFRYAFVKVSDESLAEDLVQETYLAAVKSFESYQGRSTERTWLTSILNHKIADYFRKHSKEVSFNATDLDNFGTKRFFRQEGFWSGFWNKKFRPASWGSSPYKLLENKEFYVVLEKCLGDLPSNAESIFRLRELDGMDSKELCEIFNLSSSNYWVIMHRSRLLLRRCIEINWFVPEKR